MRLATSSRVVGSAAPKPATYAMINVPWLPDAVAPQARIMTACLRALPSAFVLMCACRASNLQPAAPLAVVIGNFAPRRRSHALAAVCACWALGGFGFGLQLIAEVTTNPVGYVNIGLLRNSDTIVAVPLALGIEFSGSFSAITLGADGCFTAHVASPVGFITDQFKKFYYVRVRTGNRRGTYFTIVSNSANELTLDSAGHDYSAIAPGDSFCIRRYWTLSTLFPPSVEGTASNPLQSSLGPLGPQRRSQVIIPDSTYDGINLPAIGVYYFTATGWHQAVAGNPNADDIILYPDTSFTVRQPAGIASDATWSLVGSVVEEDQRIPLFTRTSGGQDNAVALNRPIEFRLADSGLATGFVASSSTLGAGRRDQLMIFDNSVRAQNKPASAVYYLVGDNWIRAAFGNPSSNDDLISSTAGMVVRKYETPTGVTAEWLNSK